LRRGRIDPDARVGVFLGKVAAVVFASAGQREQRGAEANVEGSETEPEVGLPPRREQ
jgi:hypothetical protein